MRGGLTVCAIALRAASKARSRSQSEGDSTLVIAALRDIARSQGITHLTKETGLDYESLHQALSSEENPEFATVLKVIQALGLKLQATPM